MVAKKVMTVLFVVFAAVALVGCATKNGRPLVDPGGPIIVVVPEPELGLTAANPTLILVPDYTGWYAGCPDSNKVVPEAERVSTYKGIPWRLGNAVGASIIEVTLRPDHKSYPFQFSADGNTFTASTVDLEFKDPPNLTIRLEGPGKIPTWTLDPQGQPELLQPKWIVPVENLSRFVYGHITKLHITDGNGNSADVDLADLISIKIFYNPTNINKKCS